MKKLISLLLCIITLLSCIGCESIVNNVTGTTEPTEITISDSYANPFGEVLERLKENVSYSMRKDETQLYLLSDGEKASLAEMLKSIVFLNIDKSDYKDKTSVPPRDKTQWIEIIFGKTDAEKCVLTVFSDGMIYATHIASGTSEAQYFVSAEVAVVYYSFSAYLAKLLVSDGNTDQTYTVTETVIATAPNGPETMGGGIIQQPLTPFDELVVKNEDGTVQFYNVVNDWKRNIYVRLDRHIANTLYFPNANDRQTIADIFKETEFIEIESSKESEYINTKQNYIQIYFVSQYAKDHTLDTIVLCIYEDGSTAAYFIKGTYSIYRYNKCYVSTSKSMDHAKIYSMLEDFEASYFYSADQEPGGIGYATIPEIDYRPFDEITERNPDGTISIFSAIDIYSEFVDVFDHTSPVIKRISKKDYVGMTDYFYDVRFSPITKEQYMLIETATDYGCAIEVFFKNRMSVYTLTVMPDGKNYLKYSLTSDGTEKYYRAESDFMNRDIISYLLYNSYCKILFPETSYITGVSLYDGIKSVSDYIVCWDHNKTVTDEKSKAAILELLKEVKFFQVNSIMTYQFEADDSQVFYISTEEKNAYVHNTYQIVTYVDGSICLDHVTKRNYEILHNYYVAYPGSVDVDLLGKYLENH